MGSSALEEDLYLAARVASTPLIHKLRAGEEKRALRDVEKRLLPSGGKDHIHAISAILWMMIRKVDFAHCLASYSILF